MNFNKFVKVHSQKIINCILTELKFKIFRSVIIYMKQDFY